MCRRGPDKKQEQCRSIARHWEGGASLNSRRILAVRVSRLRINSRLLDRKILHITFLAGGLGAIAGNSFAQLPPKAPNSSVITLTPQPGYFTEPAGQKRYEIGRAHV